jgi:hypothetical protein
MCAPPGTLSIPRGYAIRRVLYDVWLEQDKYIEADQPDVIG